MSYIVPRPAPTYILSLELLVKNERNFNTAEKVCYMYSIEHTVYMYVSLSILYGLEYYTHIGVGSGITCVGD